MSEYNILWVEDNANNLTAMVNTLKKNGFKIDIAQDFESAKGMIGEKKYDLIILDILIPSGKKMYTSVNELIEIQDTYFGIEFLKLLSKKSPPIIIFSVTSDQNDISIQCAKFPQIKATLQKGICQSSEFLTVVQKILKT